MAKFPVTRNGDPCAGEWENEMGLWKTAAMATVAVFMAAGAWAAPLKLTPANPQPSGLKQGLAVKYAYPKDV